MVGRRRVFAVGHRFSRSCNSRWGSSLPVADFVEQAPDKNGGMIDVLPDEIQQLVARGFSNSGVSRTSLTCGISAQTRIPAWSHRL